MPADLLIQGSQTRTHSSDDKVAAPDPNKSVQSFSDSETVNSDNEKNSTGIAIGSSQEIAEGISSCQEKIQQQTEQTNVNIQSNSAATFEPTNKQFIDNPISHSKLNACTDDNSLVSVSQQSSDKEVCETTTEVKQEDSVKDVEVSSGSVKDKETFSTVCELVEPKIMPPSTVEPNRKISSTGATGQAVGTVSVLRATSVRRKASAIVSFTTEDFDLFHSK